MCSLNTDLDHFLSESQPCSNPDCNGGKVIDPAGTVDFCPECEGTGIQLAEEDWE